MIDTIALTLNEGMFRITNHQKFSPSTLNLFEPPYYRLGGRGSFHCIQNPTVQDYKNGDYLPRLKVTKRMKTGGFETVLRVEFSAPKLIFGNNFDELTNEHFGILLVTLEARLEAMGVWVNSLENALVSAIHYSKNVILTDGSTPYGILQELSKANYSLRLDTNQTDFRNEGHSFKYRTNSFEVALYDKLKDLRQAKISEKRAEETDNAIQLNIFETGSQSKKPFEVLRMEVRLNTRTKIKQTMSGLGIIGEPTFINLFKSSTAQAVLNSHWQDIEDGYKLVSYTPKNTKDLLVQLMTSIPKISSKKALQLVGLKTVVDEIGIRELRQIIANDKHKNWYRLYKEALEIEWPKNAYSMLHPVVKALNEFEAVKLSEYRKEVYNVT